jgi:hypothetical protein
MIRHFCICFCLALVSAAIPLRAANRPHAGTDSQTVKVWTNDDLEKLHDLGLICIVGQINEETPKPASLLQPYLTTRNPEWYAEQAAQLRDELERRRAQLDGYRQAIEDARSLKTMTGGMNLDGGDIGITPEAGIEILEQRVMEEQARLDDLEDLARRNDIEPGTLRGQ